MISSDDIWGVVRPRLQQYLIDAEWDITLLEKFLRVHPDSMGGWVLGSKPLAQQIIQMWHLFAALGYESPELEGLAEENRYYGKLFALGVATMEDMKDLLDVKGTQTVVQVMRGQTPAHPKFKLKDLCELYGGELQAKLDTLPVIDHKKDEAIQSPAAESTDTTVPMPGGVDPVVLLATLVSTAIPLAWNLIFNGSRESRDQFRKAMTPDQVFRATNLFGALCSERALEEGLRQGLGQL